MIVAQPLHLLASAHQFSCEIITFPAGTKVSRSNNFNSYESKNFSIYTTYKETFMIKSETEAAQESPGGLQNTPRRIFL